MQQIFALDPISDTLSSYRGPGRFVSLMKEALKGEITWVTDLSQVPYDSILIIPFWFPFKRPFLTKKVAQTQILVIFDLIPLKWPKHFPVGLKGKANLFLNKRSLKVYDSFITISEHSKSDIAEILRIPLDKIHVAHLFISKDLASGSAPTKPEALPSSYFLYVGDVNWNKNLPNLARAIKRQDLPCFFVGKAFKMVKTDETTGHPELASFYEFQALAKDDPRFIFPGYIDNDMLQAYYKHAIANILVSYDEGFGLSFLEAAHQGCPSVLSDIPVFREIAAESALFVAPNEPESIADGMQRMIKARGEYSQKVKSRAKEFSAASFHTSFLKTLK